jgi:hypothetical protein
LFLYFFLVVFSSTYIHCFMFIVLGYPTPREFPQWDRVLSREQKLKSNKSNTIIFVFLSGDIHSQHYLPRLISSVLQWKLLSSVHIIVSHEFNSIVYRKYARDKKECRRNGCVATFWNSLFLLWEFDSYRLWCCCSKIWQR